MLRAVQNREEPAMDMPPGVVDPATILKAPEGKLRICQTDPSDSDWPSVHKDCRDLAEVQAELGRLHHAHQRVMVVHDDRGARIQPFEQRRAH